MCSASSGDLSASIKKFNGHHTPSGVPLSQRRRFKSIASPTSPSRLLSPGKGEEEMVEKDYLMVNVTRSSHGATDMAPFKIVTKVRSCVCVHCVSVCVHCECVYIVCVCALCECV